MNSKIRPLLLLSFFLMAFNCVVAQELKIEGRIMDKNTKEPVFGAIVHYGGKVMSFSDNNGNFQLFLSNADLKDSITIAHLIYHAQSVSLADLKSKTNNIYLEEKIFSMDEVVIKPINVKKLLKEIKNQFRESYHQLPCWAEANYTQLISYKGQPCSYMECNGNILLMGSKEKIPFVMPFIIPSQVRRTKENPVLASVALNSFDATIRNQVTGAYMGGILTEYRFFEVCHPLNPTLTHNFDFQLDSVTHINNTSCYLFSFTQKSKIVCHTWYIYGMKGQMWVDVNNKNLLKVMCVFNRGDLASTQVGVDYYNLNNTTYPLNISLQEIHNKYLTKLLSQKIFVESTVNISKIDVQERDYARKYRYEIESYLPFFKYNKDYWLQYPIKDNNLRNKVLELMGKNNWDVEFEEGSTQKVFHDSKVFDSSFKKFSDEAIEIMKRDLKMDGLQEFKAIKINALQ